MLLESFRVDDGIVNFVISKELKNAIGFKDDFWFKYLDVDCTKIPSEILSIPFILNIAPVVWVSGLKLSIDVIDEQLSISLIKLKNSLAKMYPDVNWDGEITYSKVTNSYPLSELNETSGTYDSIMLFSGGLDSIATSIHHEAERQCLLSICGADIGLSDVVGWDRVKENCREYASKHKAKNYFVESNFHELFLPSKLNEYKSIPNWWAYVQHGMGLTSFMAIPGFIEKTVKGYIGSTHTAEFNDKPWGSKPEIDNNVFWYELSVSHDCYDYTRQQKSNLIVDVIKRKKLTAPKLRVCYASDGGENCCLCEKCSRTISSLWVQGENHEDYGFEVKSSDIIKNVRLKFLMCGFKFDDNEVYHWNDIVKYGKIFSSEDKYVNEYLEWLSTFNFERYKNKCQKYLKIRRKISDVKFIKVVYKFLIKYF